MGVLLVDFLRLFGRSLNSDDVGISCSNGGYFYNKLDAQKDQPTRPYMLSVEDPADPDNDLSKGSWNFLKVLPHVICYLPKLPFLQPPRPFVSAWIQHCPYRLQGRPCMSAEDRDEK